MQEISKFDVAEYLDTKEDVIEFLNAVLEENPSMIAAALGDISRSKGMTQLAKETGITRDGLYKALCEKGNPSFNTVEKVLNALGFKFKIVSVA